MTPLDRQPEPLFWASREARYLAGTRSAGEALHDFQHEGRSLAQWFHDRVRPAGDEHLCAYCDGTLEETSPRTIDHFIPEHADRDLGLRWTNLFPACACCNSSFKGKRWSCKLVRPDLDPVDRWLVYHVDTGRLEPAPELSRRTRARVRMTLRVLGLNSTTRCKARGQIWRCLEIASKAGEATFIEQYARSGPYRFVAALFLRTMAAAPAGLER